MAVTYDDTVEQSSPIAFAFDHNGVATPDGLSYNPAVAAINYKADRGFFPEENRDNINEIMAAYQDGDMDEVEAKMRASEEWKDGYEGKNRAVDRELTGRFLEEDGESADTRAGDLLSEEAEDGLKRLSPHVSLYCLTTGEAILVRELFDHYDIPAEVYGAELVAENDEYGSEYRWPIFEDDREDADLRERRYGKRRVAESQIQPEYSTVIGAGDGPLDTHTQVSDIVIAITPEGSSPPHWIGDTPQADMVLTPAGPQEAFHDIHNTVEKLTRDITRERLGSARSEWFPPSEEVAQR